MTGKGIYGVKFLLSDARGNPIGTYESDNEGYVYIDHELEDGRYTIQEIECAEGYLWTPSQDRLCEVRRLQPPSPGRIPPSPAKSR